MDNNEDATVAMYDLFHKMAMNADDPSYAIAGRCLKRFYEAFDDFENEETERGQHHGVVVFGILQAASIIIASTVLSGAKKGCEDNIINASVDVFRTTLMDMAKVNAQVRTRMEGENR